MFFFQAEDGIRDLVRSRGLGDVYKRQGQGVGLVALQDVVGRLLQFPGVGCFEDGFLVQDLSLIHI